MPGVDAVPLAAEAGFSFGDPFAVAIIFVGIAVLAAVGALSHEHDRAFSASLIYLGLGAGAAVIIQIGDVSWLQPIADAMIVERAAEFAVVFALFATGLKLDRSLAWREWTGVARLLVIAMPLTIAAVAAYGTEAMGLSLGAAIALGATLAPTDPVLAGDVGVGPPGDEEEHEPNFSITGEAGLNDGLAFPFVFLGIVVATEASVVEWALADALYAIGGAFTVGALLGYALAALAVWLRDRQLLSASFDGWLSLGAVPVIYGAAEVAGTYGFVAVFVGGVAFRRYERTHEYNRAVHDGADVVEKFAELGVVLLLGSMLTLEGLGEPGVAGLLLVPLLLLVIRPLSVLIAFLGVDMPGAERRFVGWFGVRGVGSLYYAAVIIEAGVFSGEEQRVIFWTTAVVAVVSIVVHGVTAAPLSRRWLPASQR